MENTDAPKWTPGPWDKVVKMEGFTAVGADTLIARVFSRAFRDTENEAANAALVAAAPELYDALVALLPLAEQYLWRAPSHPDNAKIEDARAAICKATGK